MLKNNVGFPQEFSYIENVSHIEFWALLCIGYILKEFSKIVVHTYKYTLEV